jgi:hypothetical protein
VILNADGAYEEYAYESVSYFYTSDVSEIFSVNYKNLDDNSKNLISRTETDNSAYDHENLRLMDADDDDYFEPYEEVDEEKDKANKDDSKDEAKSVNTAITPETKITVDEEPAGHVGNFDSWFFDQRFFTFHLFRAPFLDLIKLSGA